MNSTISRTIHARIVGSAASLALFGMMNTLTANAGQQELAASLGATRDEVVQTRDQLQATVDALAALEKQKSGDMRPTYDAFVAQIAKTETAATTTRARVAKMEGEAATHFGTWQKDVDGISNPSLKDKAQKRLASVQKSYDKVVVQLKDASSRFTPLLSDLGDIQKTLVNDLTPGGVKSVRSSVSDAQWNLKTARRAIYAAVEELTKMEHSLGTTAPQ
jgi:hypothetical protein